MFGFHVSFRGCREKVLRLAPWMLQVNSMKLLKQRQDAKWNQMEHTSEATRFKRTHFSRIYSHMLWIGSTDGFIASRLLNQNTWNQTMSFAKMFSGWMQSSCRWRWAVPLASKFQLIPKIMQQHVKKIKNRSIWSAHHLEQIRVFHSPLLCPSLVPKQVPSVHVGTAKQTAYTTRGIKVFSASGVPLPVVSP